MGQSGDSEVGQWIVGWENRNQGVELIPLNNGIDSEGGRRPNEPVTGKGDKSTGIVVSGLLLLPVKR